MGRFARRIFLALGLSLAAGCISPTLPMPPPGEPEVDGPTAEGTATLSGKVPEPNARVFAINWSEEERGGNGFAGDYADDQGYYRFEIQAQVGDRCELWYEYGGEESYHRDFDIPDPG